MGSVFEDDGIVRLWWVVVAKMVELSARDG